AEPAAISVDSLDSADSDLADAAVAAVDGSDEGRPELKHARMDEPQERGENADDAASGSGPAVIRVGRTARVLNYFDAAKLLGAAKIRSKNLEQSRQALLRNHKRKTDRVALSIFDFHALVMNEPTLTHAKYARQKSSRNTWKEITCLRLSYGLKGLRVKCVHRPDRVYTVVETTRVSPAKHYVEDAQTGKISVKNLFEAKYGVCLEYPRLPVVVVVHSANGRREFVPMECVQVVENKKLLFVSILAARQVFKFTVDAAPTKRKRHRRRPQGAPVAVIEAH
ncbi:PAZ domain-containing protein, partial [Aphelenchoides avenae]